MDLDNGEKFRIACLVAFIYFMGILTGHLIWA